MPALLLVVASLVVASCSSGSNRPAARSGGQESPKIISDAQKPTAGREKAEIRPLISGEIVAPSRLIVEGTEVFVQPPKKLSAQEKDNGEYELRIENAPLEDIVRFIMGELLDESFLVEGAIEGQASVQIAKPVSRESVLNILDSMLSANGYSLVQKNGVYLISARAKLSAPLVLKNRSAVGRPIIGVLTEVFVLEFVSPDQLASLIEPLLPESVVLSSQPQRGLLIITGGASERAAAAQFIHMFDVDQLAGRSFALIPVASANPTTIIRELQEIFRENEKAGTSGFLRLVPIERLGSILVIAARRHLIQQVQQWVDRLDRGQATDQQRLYVYYVQHGDTIEIAKTIGSIFLGSGGVSQTLAGLVEGGQVAPGMVPTQLGSPEPPGAEIVSKDPVGSGYGAISGLAPGITPDPSNNALFILATPKQYELIEAAIRHIDLRPTQVMIEATIAEVTLNNELRYGVQWFFRQSNNEFTLSNAASGVPAAQFPGFLYAFSRAGADIILDTLEGFTDVNVVSSPQLMVLNNRTAELRVGDQVPVAVQSAVSVQNPDAPIVNQIEFKDTGIILRVTPSVNASDTVTLEIELEVSNVVPTTTSGIDSPTIQQRIITSTVSIQDGQSIALGGLIRERAARISSGLPVLSKIPLIGGLFGQKQKETSRTELIIIISPRIILTPQDALDVTRQLGARLKQALRLVDEINYE